MLKGDSKTTKDVTFYKSGYVTNDDMDLFLEGSTAAIDKKDIADAVASGKKLYTEAAKAAGQKQADDKLAKKGTDYAYLTKITIIPVRNCQQKKLKKPLVIICQ